jgi:hypothetical protein
MPGVNCEIKELTSMRSVLVGKDAVLALAMPRVAFASAPEARHAIYTSRCQQCVLTK